MVYCTEKQPHIYIQLNISQIQEKKDQLRREWIEFSSAWIKEAREDRDQHEMAYLIN